MAVLVESCERTKSGKAWRVKLSGTYYNAFLDSGIENQVGNLIEAEIQTNEKYGPSIRAWKPSALPGQVPVPASPYATPQTPTTRIPEPEHPKYAAPAKDKSWLPMASNVVAHAIAAGKIETPDQVGKWVMEVRNAVVNADDLPF